MYLIKVVADPDSRSNDVFSSTLMIRVDPPKPGAVGVGIDRALSEAIGEDDAHRETVLRLLRRAEVRGLAAELQLDLRRAEAAVATLEGEELRSADEDQ